MELAYTIPQIRSLSPSSKIILDCHNAEYGLQQRARKVDAKNPRRWPAYLYSSIQVRRLKSFEAWACRAVDWVVAVSDEDKQQLLELMPEINITVIPNCINVSEYAMDRQETAYQYDLLFTGKMDYRPNIDAVLWFAESIWPKVLKERPQTTWAIVGQNPHPRLHKLASSEGIKIIGWVERIQAYLSGATVFIMPFRVGSGTRLKLIEAMASGIPVVSTRLGVEGFRVKDDRELMIADQPEDFSKAILTLLEDSKKRVRLVTAATTFANQYDYRRVIPKFDKLYKQLLQSKVNTQ